MNIKTKLHIGTFLAAVMAVLITLLIVWRARSFEGIAAREKVTSAIINAVIDLNTASFDYISNPSSAEKEQWINKYNTLKALTGNIRNSDDIDAGILESTTEYTEKTRIAFDKLTTIYENGSLNPESTDISEHRKELVDNIWTYSRSNIRYANALLDNTRHEITAIRAISDLLITGIVVSVAVIVGFISFLLNKTISSGITELLKGTERVADGDLMHRVEVVSDDEFATLSRAFNSMTTRLMEANRKLDSVRQKAIQQERLQALRQMARGIIHDFNNALSPILGATDLLIHNPKILDDREQTLRFLQSINERALMVGEQVKRLRRYFVTTKNRNPEPADINAIIKDAVKIVEPKWKEEAGSRGIAIDIVTKFDARQNVQANAADMTEVFVNLLVNSVDAMPRGGTIAIRTCDKGKQVIIQLKDDGHGMPEDVKANCFEPFFSTREGAMGMGLTMVFGTVKSHDGTVTLESGEKEGTTVSVTLPATDSKPEASPSETKKPLPGKAPGRVLIVDDDDIVCELTRMILEQEGHTVQVVNDGRSAIDAFRTDPHDIVIADRAMPEMSGDDLAREIKKINPSTPVIMLTGFGAAMVEEGVRPDGVDMVVPKPVTQKDILEAISKVTTG